MAETFDIWLAIRWLSAFILLWIIASIPGYWVLSVWMILRDAYVRVVRAFAGFAASSRSSRTAQASAARAELQVGLGSFEVDEVAAAAWTETIDAMAGKLRATSDELVRTRGAAVESTGDLELATRRIKRLNLVSDRVPEIPSADAFLRQTHERRKAIVNCFLASVLLLAIAWANAQLTGLVLRDYLPPLQPLFGLPLFLVIAFVVVIAEAAIGLLHSMAADRQNEERRITLAEMGLVGLGLLVALLEAGLYAAIDPKTELRLPIGGSVFGAVGFVLGIGVFGLGRAAHASLMTVRKAGSAKQLAKGLERLRESADEWNATAERVGPTHAKALEAFEGLAASAKDSTQAFADTGTKFLAALEAHKSNLPDWARASNRPISEAEFREKESRAYFWLALGFLSLMCLSAICWYLSLRFGSIPSITFGAGLGLAAFGFGAFGAQSGPKRQRPRAYALAALFLGMAALTLFIEKLLTGAISLNAVGILAPAAGAFVSGLQLGPIALLRLPFTRLLNAFITVALYVALALCWVLNAFLAVVEYALRIIAWPSHWVATTFLTKRREREALV